MKMFDIGLWRNKTLKKEAMQIKDGQKWILLKGYDFAFPLNTRNPR